MRAGTFPGSQSLLYRRRRRLRQDAGTHRYGWCRTGGGATRTRFFDAASCISILSVSRPSDEKALRLTWLPMDELLAGFRFRAPCTLASRPKRAT